MLNSQFSPWPCFTDEEGDAVRDVLLSNRVNYWTGSHGREFEKEFASWAGTDYAVALANGTLALDAALHGLNIGVGDEVIVTPRTFLASVSTVVNAGATPVFADVDRNTQNLSATTIAEKVTEKTKAVIVVHLAGMPAEMDAIMELANAHGFYVIEDCAQAHGAQYRGLPIGSIGHVGTWSFCQDKIMTTGGEGGMITTSDESVWRRIWAVKDHGKSYEAVYGRQHPPGFRWLHESFGNNWRMTEMQAAIGRIQLKRMPEWTRIRTQHATKLSKVAGRHAVVRLPELADYATHAWYKFYCFVKPERLAAGWDRDRIVAEVTEQGVPCMQGSCSEVYLEKAFEGTGLRPEKPLPIARELGETSLMFVVHPTLTDDEVRRTCEVMDEVFARAGCEC